MALTKERDEERAGDGSYFRSWIWLSNPQLPNSANNVTGEDAASDEDVNEVICVEWTTSFARLERWTEEVDLLQEEMRRVVMFLEWKSANWLAKAGVRKGTLTFDIQSGLDAYARKQAAVYHNLAVSFAKLWRPTLASYCLDHSWITAYMTEHNVLLSDTCGSVPRARGIFKFRLSDDPQDVVLPAMPASSESSTAGATMENHQLLEEATYSDDSDLEGSCNSEIDWDEDL